MAGNSKRVMVIALSETTMSLIEPWANAGLLPAFRRFMLRGASGTVEARIPFSTMQMWANIVTGKGAGHHGIHEFWQRGSDGRFTETGASDLKEPPIWRILSDRGVKCGIANLPLNYPSQPSEGFALAGQDAPGAHRSIAYPPSLYDEIVRKFGAYHLKEAFPGGRPKSDYLTLLPEQIERQTEVLHFLVTEKEWDFFMCFYSATAMAQHYFWAEMESSGDPFGRTIESTYRALDASIDRLVAAAGPETTTFIISECGAGRLKSGMQLNKWLSQEGFLTYKSDSRRSPRNDSVSKYRTGIRNAIVNLRYRAPRYLPGGVYYWANRHLKGLKSRIESYLLTPDIDWGRTRAFSRGKEGDIFINLKGRDPKGVVNPGLEYEAVRDAIIESLSGLVYPPTGERVVTAVFKAEDLFDGPGLEYAPDLVVEWRDGAFVPTEQVRGEDAIFVPRWREGMSWPSSGSHRKDGILLAMGPGIPAGVKLRNTSVFDLMPTWLEALGQPVPTGLEGEAIPELSQEARILTHGDAR